MAEQHAFFARLHRAARSAALCSAGTPGITLGFVDDRLPSSR